MIPSYMISNNVFSWIFMVMPLSFIMQYITLSQAVSGFWDLCIQWYEHLPSRASEIEHFEMFSHLQENQVAGWFFVNLICYCSFSIPNVLSVFKDKTNLCNMYKKTSWNSKMSATHIYQYDCCEMLFFSTFS